MSETDILKKILPALCKEYAGRGLFYRRNVGAVKTTDRLITFGLPGQADIAGIISGQAIEIEVKTNVGKQSEAQKNWQKAVERAGGVYILARSIDDCLSQLNSIIKTNQIEG